MAIVNTQNTESPAQDTQEYINIINNNPYRFNLGLFTSDGRYQQLKMGAINSLILVDSFTNFYHEGYIIINNTFDAAERMVDFETQQNIAANTTINTTSPKKGFIFKGDSRDLLVVDIMPVLTEDSDFNFNTTDKEAENYFKLSFTFSIYNTEEIPGSAPGEKFKKLYFWDMHYELLREKNSYFSTANYTDADDVANSDDSSRSIYTGEAIKSFLTEFFSEEDGWPVTIGDKFDQGATKTFFSAPAGFKGADCLEYLMARHVSNSDNNYDQAFLRAERNTSIFNLQSLRDVFKTALNTTANSTTPQVGSGYLETFKLGIYSDVNNEFTIENIAFTPPDALFLDKYGTINNFNYDPMPGAYSQQDLVSVIVHNYNTDEKQFNIDQNQHSIQSTLCAYDANYVQPFNPVSFAGAYPNFFPGQYRMQQKNVKNIFTVVRDSTQRLSSGRNKAIFNNIFLNNTMLFKVPGSTHRTAGSFIGINRDNAFAFSDFDSKVLGIYLIIEVKHIFQGNEYFNEIRCVKTYSYDNLQLIAGSR